MKVLQPRSWDDAGREQRVNSARDQYDEGCGCGVGGILALRELQDQCSNDNVLGKDEGCFTIRAERPSGSNIVSEGDEEGESLEEDREERETCTGLRGEDLQDLGDLDDRASEDYHGAQGLGDQ